MELLRTNAQFRWQRLAFSSIKTSRYFKMESTEDFADRMNSMLIQGFTCMSVSIGYELGLFDLLAEMKEPKTSQEIADAGNMKERYVREWLGAMVTAKIIELDSTGDKYFLSTSKAPFLTKGGSVNDAVSICIALPSLGGGVYKKIKECFERDGPRGVSYQDYEDCCKVVSEESRCFLERHLISTVIPSYPDLKEKLEEGINVVDIGCGQGVSTVELAKAFPKSTFYGVDFQDDSLKIGREKAESLGLTNAQFVSYDAAKLPKDWTGKFDFAFMHDALHDQAYPDKVLGEVFRVLAPGGLYWLKEPIGYTKVKDNLEKLDGLGVEYIYSYSLLHCMPVSLYFEGGWGLGGVWGQERAAEMLKKAGFEILKMSFHKEWLAQHFYCIRTRSAAKLSWELARNSILLKGHEAEKKLVATAVHGWVILKTSKMESSEDFAARMATIVRHTCTSTCISIGYELGLFDLLAELKEPKTSQEIADAGNMKERYVREWLGAMVCSKIVDLDSAGEKYFLPASRVPALTKGGSLNGNVTLGAQIPGVGGDVYQKVKECFKVDGPRGLPYDAYDMMCAMNKERTRGFLQDNLISTIISQYPELKERLEKGSTALDVGCGYGVSIIEMAKAFPKGSFYGIDFQEESTQAGKKEAETLGLKNAHFLIEDAAKLPSDWDEKFNFVFMNDALHDQAYPDKVLQEVYRVLAPGGLYLALEPMGYSKVKDNLEKLNNMEIMYMFSLMHCMPVSLYFEGGRGLGAAMGREKAEEMLKEAGFEVIEISTSRGDFGQHYYCKKPLM
ncbi:Sterol 24-C-methyltransferase [Holothuria leucospilota]|uniref:Sterol 24-C-methyltransferase n=1 Tax=Holothuria leucospilota TaxID=206669 RepID=A0A9Q1BMG9_HOLLE|nr:Sterol 24-C-methyltransferase [Holothuria leucospilota]